MEPTTLDIKAFMEANPKLITRKESTTYPGLYVLKYSRKVFYDGLWTPELEWCRGLVVDANWNVVVQPFKKIYNRFERDTNFPDDWEVSYFRKVNGFMAAVTFLPANPGQEAKLIVSTTGSLDSDFILYAEQQLFKNKLQSEWIEYMCKMNMPHMTMLFEIVHPDDPHIVKEGEGAYGLALNVRPEGFNPQGLDSMFFPEFSPDMAKSLGVFSIVGERGPFRDVVKKAAACEHEGYVAYLSPAMGNRALKIKSPYYLTRKLFARAGTDRLMRILDDPSSSKMKVDEEYYPLIAYLGANKEHFSRLSEQHRLAYIQEYFDGQCS